MPTDATETYIMPNGTDPSDMTGQERLAEVSMLLSLAMMRLWLKRRVGAGRTAASERGISRDFSLGLGAESRPNVADAKTQG